MRIFPKANVNKKDMRSGESVGDRRKDIKNGRSENKRKNESNKGRRHLSLFFRPQSVVMCVYVSGTGGKIEKKLNF